jgi:hypothetical protein
VRWILVVALAACSTGSSDITGPFTGQSQRFYLAAIQIPADSAQHTEIAADLDGNGSLDNQFGTATSVLGATNDLSQDSADMIASGALTMVVDIQADDLLNDPSVGVTIDGGTVFGGQIIDGTFISNRARDTQHPGTATLHLPVFTNATPVTLEVAGELDLAPSRDGYHAVIRGRVDGKAAHDAAFAGVREMFETEPQRHLQFMRSIDFDHDGSVSDVDLEGSVIHYLLEPDLDEEISLAISFDLSPAPVMRPPMFKDRDRVRDEDETDIDCGGSAQRCWDGKACSVASDCQSNACNGTCAVSTCTDGVRDGFESDIDCGATCGKCVTGRVCAGDADCASNSCDNSVSSLGHCS